MSDSITRVGDTTARIVAEDREFDPISGVRTIQRWEGEEEDLLAQAQLFLAAGYRVTTRHLQGPVYEMLVMVPDAATGDPDQVLDTFERVTEMAQVDIRLNPQLINSVAPAPIAGQSPASIVNHHYREFKEHVRKGDYVEYASPALQAFFDLVARGAEAYETTRTVLRRRRTIHISQVAQSEVVAIDRCYTTAKLIEIFSIPEPIADKLPADPSITPSNTAWSWRERTNTSTIAVGLYKVEEVREWTFAAWSTILYELIKHDPL